MSRPHTQLNSIITLPIKVDLIVLENYINTTLPHNLLEVDEPNRVCIKPQYLKTICIPKCKRDGYKISCKKNDIEIRTIPKVKCDLKGWVKRDGNISVLGESQALKISFPIKSHITASSPLNASANAAATIVIDVIPHINKDWSISLDVKSHFKWSKIPSLTLFKSLKVNIKDKVEKRLRKKIQKLIRKIPQHLHKLGFKEKVNTAWHNMQKPINIDKKSDAYLLFKPESIDYSGFAISDTMLTTTISAQGKTEIILGNPLIDSNKIKLCNLGSTSCEEGKFNFNLPITVSYEELITMYNKKLSDNNSIEFINDSLPGSIKISNPKIKKNTVGQLSITVNVSYDKRSKWLQSIDLFDWFDIDGKITFTGIPKIEKDSRTLILDELYYDSTTNNDLFDTLIDIADTEALKPIFSKLLRFEFGQKIDEGIIKANKALKSYSKNDINVTTNLQMASIEELTVNEKNIIIYTELSGTIHADIKMIK